MKTGETSALALSLKERELFEKLGVKGHAESTKAFRPLQGAR